MIKFNLTTKKESRKIETEQNGIHPQSRKPRKHWIAFITLLLSDRLQPSSVCKCRAALFTAVTVETALFLLFHQRHLLSDSGVTLSFILTAVCLQTNANMGTNYCCKSLPVDEKQAILLRIYFIVLQETFMDFYQTNKIHKRWCLTAVWCVFR